jgi:hypothetical protein
MSFWPMGGVLRRDEFDSNYMFHLFFNLLLFWATKLSKYVFSFVRLWIEVLYLKEVGWNEKGFSRNPSG